jgi:hypothetical protein
MIGPMIGPMNGSMNGSMNEQGFLEDKKAASQINCEAVVHSAYGMPGSDKLKHFGLYSYYIPMPLMPPMPPGIAGPALSSSGSSETIASVVNIKPAIEAAF